MCISGAPSSGTNFHVRFYPDVRLTAQIYKKFLAGSPADGSQRVNVHFNVTRHITEQGLACIVNYGAYQS